ncbi:hypothetical protein V8F33_005979 [Rhypophila sp. PSN 637]
MSKFGASIPPILLSIPYRLKIEFVTPFSHVFLPFHPQPPLFREIILFPRAITRQRNTPRLTKSYPFSEHSPERRCPEAPQTTQYNPENRNRTLRDILHRIALSGPFGAMYSAHLHAANTSRAHITLAFMTTAASKQLLEYINGPDGIRIGGNFLRADWGYDISLSGLMVPETDDPKDDVRANPSRVVLFKGPRGLVTNEAIIGQLQSRCLDNEYQAIVEVKEQTDFFTQHVHTLEVVFYSYTVAKTAIQLEDPSKGITAVDGADPMEVASFLTSLLYFGEDYAKDDQFFNDRANTWKQRAREWELSGKPLFYEIPARSNTTASELASETVCGSDSYDDKSRIEDAWTIVKPVARKSSKKPRATAARPQRREQGVKGHRPSHPGLLCYVILLGRDLNGISQGRLLDHFPFFFLRCGYFFSAGSATLRPASLSTYFIYLGN